ncbi:MarR family winged helix-turn-helix transcriptional regulator [Acuticoccus mangrovi]|uniref:Winged helix-turn-helix transcriptional regulator n=1 Tax=Acuticoccus mangrovi TaxID=2796142 RepID=A0A934IEG5_9HYPH|nr:MarR family winged helix-turn-helix transcriptional regulator [Acuticoccus mangrovi]MBJ3775099.1 winged helix-turn-helix transcriptional regulator [Acuticoccus mangrovi]
MDAPETSRFVRDLSTVARKMRTLFDARARESGLTYARAGLFLYLVRCKSPTQAELADALDVERPTMARLIDGMEQAGLVVRETSDSDRRVRHVVLTPAAQEQAKDVVRMSETMREQLLKGIDPEDIRIAHKVLHKMLANIQEA